MKLLFASDLARVGIRDRVSSIGLGLAFLSLCGLAALPILLVRFAPLTDFVNHLARMEVIARGGQDADLARYYSVDWQVLANLAIDLIVPPLTRFMSVYAAGKIYLIATVLTLATGPMAIHYALNRRFGVWPLVAFLFLYNQVFLVGLANYLLGAGVAAWGLAAWIMLADRTLAVRVAASTVIVAITFFCHLSALGLYGVAVGSWSLWAWNERGRRFDGWVVKELVALVAPVLPVVPLFLHSSTIGLAPEFSWDAQGKLDAILMIFRAYADAPDLGILVMVGIAFGWAVKNRLVVFHPAALVLGVIGGLVFLSMPTMLFGSYMADQRIPVALFLMLVGFGRLDERDGLVRTGFLVLVIAFSAIRVAGVSVHWLHLAAAHEEIRASLVGIERGAKIMVAHADEPALDKTDADAISHGPCAAVIERSALVSTLFTVPGKQILHVRAPYDRMVDTADGDPPTVSRLIAAASVEGLAAGQYYDGWESNHDYLYVLYTERGAANPDPDLLELEYDGPGFQLYRILR